MKNIGLIILGLLIAVGVCCLAIAIGCAVNGVSFSQQIVDWFGPKSTDVVETAETAGRFFHSLGI